ncbi:MAG: autotransporter outer membrane beta-barrel domain-containing protein [Endomicrobium sp.]|nr:autotransporter outer membrane beta-barrel domain-containing protein [Endomicrobium sp.]
MRIYNPTKILLIFIISGFLIFTGKIRVEADQVTADAVYALSTTTIQLITGQPAIPQGFVGLSAKLDVLTSTTNAGFEILTSTTDTGFTNVTNELRRGNSREEADKLKSYILNKCKNNLISGYTGLNGGVLEIKEILWSIDLYELQDTIIKNNSAANNGGAFTIVNSEKVSFYNVNVFDNEAVAGKGGAFYIENSTVIFNTNKVSMFKGNKANGSSSAMYIGANSDVYFNTSEGAIVDMNDALTNNAGTNGNLHIMGRGKFNLNETSEINGTNIKIEARGQFNLNDNVTLFSNSIGIDKDTIFCLKGNNNVQVVGGNLDISGTLEIRKGSNTIQVTTNTAIANINKGAKLQINLSPRGFDSLTFNLTASSAVAGLNNLITECDYRLVKSSFQSVSDTSMKLQLSGYGRTKTMFGMMPDLTKNQNSVADMYDRISILVPEGSMIDSLIDNRLKEQKSGVWGQIKEKYTKYGEDENSPSDYSDTERCGLVGYDMYIPRDESDESINKLSAGVYAKVNEHTLSQSNNSGNIKNVGLGVYGIYSNNDKFKVKGLINGNYGTYNTERNMKEAIDIVFADRTDKQNIGTTAKADFTGMLFGFDVEGSMEIKLNNTFKLIPYLGFEINLNSYEDIKESGTEYFDLKVENGMYSRAIERLGLRIEQEIRRFTWNAKIEYRSLLSGEQPEIKSRIRLLDGINGAQFNTVGAKEYGSKFGIGLGANYKITEDILVFAGINFLTAAKYQNVQGNIGVSYKFGSEKVKIQKPAKDKNTVKANEYLYKSLKSRLKNLKPR